jgi:hypothetical protein
MTNISYPTFETGSGKTIQICETNNGSTQTFRAFAGNQRFIISEWTIVTIDPTYSKSDQFIEFLNILKTQY